MSDLVKVADFGEQLDNYSSLAVGDYDGDGVFDLTVYLSGSQRRLFQGGKAAPTSASCVQPSTSSSMIGDWCSVKSSTLASTYTESAVR